MTDRHKQVTKHFYEDYESRKQTRQRRESLPAKKKKKLVIKRVDKKNGIVKNSTKQNAEFCHIEMCHQDIRRQVTHRELANRYIRPQADRLIWPQ